MWKLPGLITFKLNLTLSDGLLLLIIVKNMKTPNSKHLTSIYILRGPPLEEAGRGGGDTTATVTPTAGHLCLTESNEQVINPCQLLLKPGQAEPNASY